MGQHYPSTRYHKIHGSRRVENPSHEEEVCPVSEGWRESPADVVDEVDEKRGPTLEEYERAGYKAEHYPPSGYEVIDSPRYRQYLEEKAAAEAAAVVPPTPAPVVVPADLTAPMDPASVQAVEEVPVVLDVQAPPAEEAEPEKVQAPKAAKAKR